MRALIIRAVAIVRHGPETTGETLCLIGGFAILYVASFVLAFLAVSS